MLERRRNWLPQDEAWARVAAELHATDCGLYLRYDDDLDQETMQKLLHGLRRSRHGLSGYEYTTADEGRHFFVTAESAQFIREKLGAPVVQGQTSAEQVTQVMEAGYKAQRGWGVHSGARIFSGMPRSVQSPPTPPLSPPRFTWSPTNPGPPVSLREFSCNHLGSRATLKQRGIMLPDPSQLPARYDRTDPAAPDSNIDGPAIPVAEFREEVRPMMTREEAKEFLELQRAILREQMEQTELLRKQADRTQDDTDPHHVPARRRTQ